MSDKPPTTRSRRSSTALSVRSFNLRQPTLKGSSLNKNTAPVSAVSVVFAEPEQGRPLKSASGTLLSTSPVTSSTVEEELEGSPSSDTVGQGIATSRSATTSPTRPVASSSSLSLNNKPSLPNLSRSRPQRSPSLFTSLSRSKGRMAIRQLTGDQQQQPLAPIVQTIGASRLVDEVDAGTDSTPGSSTSYRQQATPVVDIQPATPGQEQDPFSCRYDESTRAASIPEPVSVSPQALPLQSPARQSWLSSTSSSPVSSPPAPQYSPPKPPLEGTLTPLKPNEPHPSESPPPISPPPPISTSTSAQTLASITSLPSSIDERVPSLPATPPIYLAKNLPKSPPLPPSTNSLNPSSSRFTLSLPLLGRSKVPLEKVASGNSGQTSDSVTVMSTIGPQSTIQTATPLESFVESPLSKASGSATLTPTQSVTDDATLVSESNNHLPMDLESHPDKPVLPTTCPLSPPADTDSSDTPTVRLPTKNDHTRQPTTWWDYVGWTSASSPPPSTNPSTEALSAQNHHDFQQATSSDEAITTSPTLVQGAEVVQPANADLISPAEAAAANVGDQITEETKEVEVATATTTVDSTPDKSTTMCQTSNEVTTTTWYAPWAWYTGSTPSDKLDTQESVKDEIVVQETTFDEEIIDEGATTTTGPTTSEAPASAEEDQKSEDTNATINPISDSFAANKLGWMEFFSSRMLTTKRVGYDPASLVEDVKRDENGMEVMEIDDDDEDGRQARGRDVGLKGVGGERANSAISGLPTTRDSSEASSRRKVAPPLTISRDIRKETEKANARLASNTSTPMKGNSRTNTPAPPSPTASVASTPPADRTKSTITTTTTTSTSAKDGKTKTSVMSTKRVASPAPSKKSAAPPPPNLVLPTWQDTFLTPPRNVLPSRPESYVDDQGVGGKLLGKTIKFVSGVLWSKDTRNGASTLKGKEKADDGGSESTTPTVLERERVERFKEYGRELPKAWSVFEDAGWDTADALNGRLSPPWNRTPGQEAGVTDVLKGCRRVVVIGVHGWFPGTMIRTVLGEPTGTSTKFASMMEQALVEFETEHGVKLDKITTIPLEGEGTIEKRVEKLYSNLLVNEEWMSDLHEADAIIVATHSQGSVVSTHLLDRLIRDGHIVTSQSRSLPYGIGAETFPSAIGVVQPRKPQRLCCLALCGIHLGPLRYLSSSTLVGPYIQYFESTAARELFEFQDTESQVSKNYVKALQNVLNNGTKMVYTASLNDQVVPLYSGLFTAVSHPLILRALYIDGDAYHSSDFLSNLLILLLRIRNSGIPESGLLAHLSEATAGSLSGVGHSTAYEELSTYSLAVKYLFLTDSGMMDNAKLTVEPFNANHEQNDYEIPWALRDIIADERVAHFFASEIAELRDAFRHWHPKTSILRDLKRKLQPITRLPSSFSSHSKL